MFSYAQAVVGTSYDNASLLGVSAHSDSPQACPAGARRPLCKRRLASTKRWWLRGAACLVLLISPISERIIASRHARCFVSLWKRPSNPSAEHVWRIVEALPFIHAPVWTWCGAHPFFFVVVSLNAREACSRLICPGLPLLFGELRRDGLVGVFTMHFALDCVTLLPSPGACFGASSVQLSSSGGQRTAAIQPDQLILQPWSVLLLALRVGRLDIRLFRGCQTIGGCFCCFVISFAVTARPPPKDSLNGSCMPLFHLRVSQLYASVCNDLGLGFLSTYLVAVAVPFPLCAVLLPCVIPACRRGPSSDVAHRILLFAEGRVFRCRGCGGDLLPEGIGLAVCSLGGSSGCVVVRVTLSLARPRLSLLNPLLCNGRLLAVQDGLLSLFVHCW